MKTNIEFWDTLTMLVREERLTLDNIDESLIRTMNDNERAALDQFIVAVNDRLETLIELQERHEEDENEHF